MLFSFFLQLQCTVDDNRMWDLICKEWQNGTNCYRDENNIVHLMSYVKPEKVEKQTENGGACLYFIPQYTDYIHQKNKDQRIACVKNATYPNNGSFKFKCTGKVNNDEVMNLIVEPAVNDDNVTQYSQFWYLFVALCFSWIGMAVVVSVGDAICFDLLGKRHELYGHQRVWGSVGGGIFSLLGGFLVDANSGRQAYKNYSVIFYLMAAALLPNTLVSSCLEVNSLEISTFCLKHLRTAHYLKENLVYF